MKDLHITFSIYVRVKDAEVFGGAGSVGYSQMSSEYVLHDEATDATSLNTRDYIISHIKYLAETLHVPEDNIETITKDEYEDETGGEDYETSDI